ncbi:MAG TPA: hypothetical protein VGH33_21695 [Isosphaeraceae bacterium]|jgi:hypothetical protein
MGTVAQPTTHAESHSAPAGPPAETSDRPGILGWLALWVILTVGLEGLQWSSGAKSLALSKAVQQGAAQIERRAFGEVSEDQVRKAMRTQNATLPFWTTLALIGDFLIEPLSMAARPLAVATLLSILAALVGRPARFGAALGACLTVQGLWVLGRAVRVALTLALGLDEAETSLALALPPGTNSAMALLAARQADAFALWGWAAMALGGWRRRQANLAVAFLVCALVALGEAALRINVALMVGAGMRLALLPA